ncbi:MAG: PaaX family transcriptional regulator C-terminal domain-containing protein [Sulfurospirillaceae bacterium]|nr:PaaX family transcriptional regulator C-terminal domain-containing protein [Sulfurospirillaceae bacterium]
MKNHNPSNEVDEYLESLLAEISPKAKSLIITFFGDTVFPYGGTIWLGSLVKFMEEFDISEKLTRTSIFRLTKEGWLSSKKFGRESYYSLSNYAIDRFVKAHYSVYAYDEQDDENNWIVLFTNALKPDKELELSKILKKEGFASQSKFTYLHPNYKMEYMQDILIKYELQNDVLLINGTADMPMNKEILKDMANIFWDLKDVEERYQSFITKFRKIFALKTPIDEFTTKQCFMLRILLIHEYRRALLYDPKLGNELVSIDWLGKAAASLVDSVYAAIHNQANEYIKENLLTVGGNNPKLDKFYFNRFGGLK